MDDVLDRSDDLLATWWAALLPDEQAEIIATRWDPVPPWISQSLTTAGVPLLQISRPGAEPRVYLPSKVEDFLDRFGIPMHKART